MNNNLTPQLNEAQLKQNIDAMHSKGIAAPDVQKYVDNYQKSPDGSYTLKSQQPPTLGQDFKADIGKAWNEASNPQDLYSPQIGGGALAKAFVLDPVNHAVKAVNSGLIRNVPAIAGLENDFSNGVRKIGNTGIGQAVSGAVDNFKQAHPRMSEAIGGDLNMVNAGLDVATAGQVVNSAKNLVGNLRNAINPAPALEKTLVGTGAVTEEEVPQVASTLKNFGLNDLSSAHDVAVTQNAMENTVKHLSETLSNSIPDAISGEFSPEASAIQKSLSAIQNAQHVLEQAIRVPVQEEAPGLVRSLVTGAADRAKNTLTYPLRHPFQAVGVGGYGAYRALGGQPLTGEI